MLTAVSRILPILMYFIFTTQLWGRAILSALIISRGRGSGKLLLPITGKKNKRAKCPLYSGNTFTVSVSCEGYSQVCTILLFILQAAGKANEQSCAGMLWCSRQRCLWCPWFLTSTIAAGPSFFPSDTNTSPFSGLWSENAAGTVSGYQEHLKDVSPRSIS